MFNRCIRRIYQIRKEPMSLEGELIEGSSWRGGAVFAASTFIGIGGEKER
jgi:hypothetical protein